MHCVSLSNLSERIPHPEYWSCGRLWWSGTRGCAGLRAAQSAPGHTRTVAPRAGGTAASPVPPSSLNAQAVTRHSKLRKSFSVVLFYGVSCSINWMYCQRWVNIFISDKPGWMVRVIFCCTFIIIVFHFGTYMFIMSRTIFPTGVLLWAAVSIANRKGSSIIPYLSSHKLLKILNCLYRTRSGSDG